MNKKKEADRLEKMAREEAKVIEKAAREEARLAKLREKEIASAEAIEKKREAERILAAEKEAILQEKKLAEEKMAKKIEKQRNVLGSFLSRAKPDVKSSISTESLSQVIPGKSDNQKRNFDAIEFEKQLSLGLSLSDVRRDYLKRYMLNYMFFKTNVDFIWFCTDNGTLSLGRSGASLRSCRYQSV